MDKRKEWMKDYYLKNKEKLIEYSKAYQKSHRSATSCRRAYKPRIMKVYKEDDIKILGWNMYMTPQQAAHGLALMQNYPENVPDLIEEGGYRDLREFTVFKK